MKKFLLAIALTVCATCTSFAQGFNIDAGLAADCAVGYESIAVGGTVGFDYVFSSKVAVFSNTDFTFASDEPNFVIAEVLGVGYRFTPTEKIYLQVGAGLGLVYYDQYQESGGTYYDSGSGQWIDEDIGEDRSYGKLGPALAVKFGIKFTDMLGMNLGFDAIYHPVSFFEDKDENIDPETHLSFIPKVCFELSL